MSVASKNLFAALGSDDEDTESRPVAKAASSKTEAKPTKKEPAVARGAERGRGGGRGRGRGRGGATAAGYSNDDAYKDRNEVLANRERDMTESRPRGKPRGPRGVGAGARGREFDRHSATGRVDTQKATNQGWGNQTTSWESAAPIAEADREEEKKDEGEAAATATARPEETAAEAGTVPKEFEKESGEEEQTQTYAEWLAGQEKSEFSIAEARKPDQSKWESATSLLGKKIRADDDMLYSKPSENSGQKTRTVSTTKKSASKKVVVEIEQRFTPIRSDKRGGRGAGRGTSERGSAPRGRGRGEDRGRGRGVSNRGRGGGGAQTIDVADTTAFPALG